MRTTIDLPDDLQQIAKSLASERGQTMSQTVVDLMRRGLRTDAGKSEVYISPVTGLLVMRGSGEPITHDQVRALEDEV